MAIINNWNRNGYGRFRQNPSWKTRDARTLTMNDAYPLGYADYLVDSGDVSDTIKEKIFNSLYLRYSELYVIWNTSKALSNNLRFLLDVNKDRYNKLVSAYDKNLLGQVEDIVQYKVGDVEGNNSDEPKYKTASQVTDKDDAGANYERLVELETPLEAVTDIISKKIYMGWVKVPLEDNYYESEEE